jgi:hypothetical protein
MSLSAIVDEVLDERLLRLEPLEGSVAISAITRTTRDCQYKRFSRCSRAGRIVHCTAILRPIVQHRLIRAGNYLHSP